MPHISITLYKGRDEETLLDVANSVRDSLGGRWSSNDISVSINEVEPSEFPECIQKRLDEERLLLTSDYVK